MSKSSVFIGMVIGFAVGALAASALPLEREYIYVYLAGMVLVFALAYLKGFQYGALLALFLFVAGLGVLRLQLASVNSEYGELFGQKQKYEGYIVQEPDIRDGRQLLYFFAPR